MAKLYRANLNKNDVIKDDTKTLVKGDYVKIGEYTVLADQLVGMGYGKGENQDNAAGRIYADFKDTTGTPVAIDGIFRIQMMSSNYQPISNDRFNSVLLDIDCSILRASALRSEQLPFPFIGCMLEKDKKFTFWIMNTAASAQTLSKANSTVSIDITKQLN